MNPFSRCGCTTDSGFSARQLGIVLGYTGGMISLIQFGLMGWLTGEFGELKPVRAAIVLFALAWVGMTQIHGMGPLLVVLTAQCFASAFFQTCMQSLLSKRAGQNERGLVLGVYQSSSSFARFIGQAGSGTIFGQIGMNAPFFMVPQRWLRPCGSPGVSAITCAARPRQRRRPGPRPDCWRSSARTTGSVDQHASAGFDDPGHEHEAQDRDEPT